ncbi:MULTISPECIES: amino acid adenylation domain-containing protein [unclassified Streptomyces]|uniref:amino acid adenylation domain-containing protein n=1 Tax=unclassified Streptomyces TaxID=2593676 RepID=UPI00081F0F9B|nr:MULTISPECIES: amino acid adenylation domain-containing protein [unclassified Streptomyces]MYZ38958.1 amino acid adenylation domain-containing protein [Streptomyces sp. SID4917]SCG01331.1 amino acid adenylation domain-containing protein [Streptomyces sp. MnatMP-M17]
MTGAHQPDGAGGPVDDILAHASRDPGAIAVVTPDTELSYGELADRIDQLGRILTARGVGPEEVCAIAVERGIDAVVAMAAVLRAGGAFLTLDVELPLPRLVSMAESGRARFLLTTTALAERLVLPVAGPTLLLDRLPAPDQDPDTLLTPLEPSAALGPRSLAYISHTSGSTGAPHAVMIERAGLDVYVRFVVRDYGLGPHTVAVQLAPLGYDASIRDIFAPLVAGGRLVLVDRARLLRADTFAATLREYGADTVLSTTPSLLTFLAQGPDGAERLGGVRTVVSSGESLRPFLAAGGRGLVDGLLVNQYGPTECTMTSTRYKVPAVPDTSVDLIGTPIDGVTVQVLDDDLRAVPDGAVGELYIGGGGVARGYRGLAALTAGRFLPDPSGPPGARMYRTGDLARRLPGGELEYLGRSDRQIKIRGHRVDPAEIEGALLTHPHITGAVVTAETDGQGRTWLYAHVTGLPSGTGDASVRAHLAGTLPPHMLPRRFSRIDRLPVTRSGKTDRGTLGRPAAPVSAAPVAERVS